MRYAFTTTVEAGKMDEYLHYHDHIWPEVCRGLRAAGVTQLTIFRAPDTATLFLYVETAGATDLADATGPGSRYRQDAKCQEWEELMDAEFHGGWTSLDEVHASDQDWVGALREGPPADEADAVREFMRSGDGQALVEAGNALGNYSEDHPM